MFLKSKFKVMVARIGKKINVKKSIIPVTDFAQPKSMSDRNILLSALMRGEVLTARGNKYEISEFSQRLKDIERMGYIVDREWVTGVTGARYKLYWMNKAHLKERAAA